MRTLLLSLLTLTALVSSAQTPQTPPYTQDFGTSAALSDFIIVDGNADGETWFYNPMIHCASCPSSAKDQGDDWLFLPLQLEAKAAYELSFHCYGNSMYAGRFDLWMGTAPTGKNGMTTQLLQPREVKYANSNDVHRASFSVETSGVYYVGFHGICNEDGNLFLDDIELSMATSTTPAAPSFVSLVPGEKGKAECALTFVLPTTTLEGQPLKTLKSVRIYRNDNLVQTLTKNINGQPLAPADTCYWLNRELSNRLYTYRICAVSDTDEEGAPATQEVYVGIDQPGRVANLRLREDLSRPGTVVMTWDAPTVGVHGGYLDMRYVTYVISTGYDSEVEVSDTRFEERLDISNGQTYKAYSIYAKNQVGSNRTNWQTISTHVGPAKQTPWREDFAGSTVKGGAWLTHVTGDTEVGEASWYTASPFAEMPEQDGNGGYTHFFTSNKGKSSRFTSPILSLRGLSSPILTFWLYMQGSEDKVEIGILPDMTEWETLETITLNGTKGWHRFCYDLSRYADSQCIQLGFNGISVERTQHITAIDNISVRNSANADAAIVAHEFPARVDMGSPAKFAVSVRNQGESTLPQGSYSLRLLARNSGEQPRTVCEVTGRTLAVDQTTEIVLTHTPDAFSTDTLYYSVCLDYSADLQMDNNQTEEEACVVFHSVLPAPTELTAAATPEGVVLTWQAPADTESALPVTDGFDYYEDFCIEDFGDWKVYDGDQQFTLTMALSTGVDIITLDYPHIGEPMAFQVFTPELAGIPYASWEPHSGNSMLVCMGNALNREDGTYHDNDDWLISPRLSGRRQQISFFAKCGMGAAYQPERLEVLYSTTDNQPESFVSLGEPIELYNVSQWDEYVLPLPEGARYFALRCVSQHKFALLLDDITYQPAGSSNINLQGYRVYRNRIALNEQPLTTLSYTDTKVAEGETLTYHISAIYDAGESLVCQPTSLIYSPTAIQQTPTELQAPQRMFDLQGRRIQRAQRGAYIHKGRILMAR